MLSDGTLEIIGVNREDTGSYTCVADNGIGIPDEKTIRVDVAGKSKI